MLLAVLLLLSSPVFGQWGTPPPVVTNQQCQDEWKEIMECGEKQPHYRDIDDGPFSNTTKNQIIVQEVSNILECTGNFTLNCNSSRIFESYLFNQMWIIETFIRLDSCINREVWNQALNHCRAPGETCVSMEVTTLCQLEQFKKRPQCTKADIRLIKKVNEAIRAGCMMEKQMEIEITHYGIPRDGRPPREDQ